MKLPGLSSTDYGLIGRPLGHSFSKQFFTNLFAADGSGRSYDNFELAELAPQSLYQVILLNPRLKGLNVTAPYKEQIIGFLDEISPEARAVGAVNTLKIRRADDGRFLGLNGYNTDVEGFRESVRPMVESLPCGSGALILGTGGASKAVAAALRSLGVEPTFVSRRTGEGRITYADIDACVLASNPLIVNATPLGTYPNVDACPPFPYELLSEANRCHDLVYNPEETLFMRRAARNGAEVKNGLEMLHKQALASLKIWETP